MHALEAPSKSTDWCGLGGVSGRPRGLEATRSNKV